jgi:hypothetical protein
MIRLMYRVLSAAESAGVLLGPSGTDDRKVSEVSS